MTAAADRRAAFVCASCARDIAAGASHVILTPHSARSRVPVARDVREADAGAMVCARCRDLPGAHQRLFPQCQATGYCDLYDHAFTLAADRVAARAWLTAHGRITTAPDTDSPTAATEGEQP